MEEQAFSPDIRSRIVRYLLLHWRFEAIAKEVHCNLSIVYRIQESLFVWDSPFKFSFRFQGRLRNVIKAVEKSLMKYLEKQSWALQKEMIWFLWEKWGINVHQSTIFNILKRRRWSEKKSQRVDHRQNEKFRFVWIVNLLNVTAKQFIFIDEILFNEVTRWRHNVYISIEQDDRYHDDSTRSRSWNVLFVYIIDEYLLCTNIKEN